MIFLAFLIVTIVQISLVIKQCVGSETLIRIRIPLFILIQIRTLLQILLRIILCDTQKIQSQTFKLKLFIF